MRVDKVLNKFDVFGFIAVIFYITVISVLYEFALVWGPFFFFPIETRSCCIVYTILELTIFQAGLELTILLPQPPKSLDDRHAPPHHGFLFLLLIQFLKCPLVFREVYVWYFFQLLALYLFFSSLLELKPHPSH